MIEKRRRTCINKPWILGVTSTMLIMAIIGALTPTLFYQMFGSFELKCIGCRDTIGNGTIACSRCYYDQMNPTKDPVYQNNVKPLMWICVIVLPSVNSQRRK